MSFSSKNKTIISISMLILSVIFTGCEDNRTIEQYIDVADKKIIDKEYDVAIIDLKNALKKYKESSQARYLLGKAYFLSGQLMPAKKELERALAEEYDLEKVIPLLVRTDALLGKVISTSDYENNLLSNETLAEIRTITGLALMTRGEYFNAIEMFGQTLNVQTSDNLYSNIAKAWLAAHDEQIEQAIQLAESSLKDDSVYNDALLFNAMLYTFNKDYDKAIAHYKTYLSSSTFNYFVQLNYVSVMIVANKLDDAEQYVDKLLAINENDPLFNEYKAELEYRKNQYQSAANYSTLSLSALPTLFKSNFIAGISHYQLGNKEQAYHHLSSVESQLSHQHMAYKILMSLRFQLGYTTEAIAAIDGLPELNADDFDLLTNASWAILNAGENTKAKEYVGVLNDISTINPKALTQRGMLKSSLNDKTGIDDFMQSIQIDPEYLQARIALLYSYLQTKDIINAHKVADDWVKEFPKKDEGYIAKGLVFLVNKEQKEAKLAFSEALTYNPKSIGANYHLSAFDIIDKKYSDAFNKNTLILSQKPSHHGSLKRIVALTPKLDNPSQSAEFIEELINNNPEHEITLSMALAQAFEKNGKLDAAIALLKEQEDGAKSHEGYIYLQGKLNLKAKQYSEAEMFFQRLLQLNSTAIESHQLLLLSFEKQKKYQFALTHINKIEEQFANDKYLQIYKASFLVFANELDKAETILAGVKSDKYNQGYFDTVKTQLIVAQKDYIKAAEMGQYLYQKDPNHEYAYFYIQALYKKGDVELAQNIFTTHINKYGTNEKLARLKAEIDLGINPNAAIKYYQNKLAKDPNNYKALNNLAWAAIQQGDYNLGVESAEKALKLAPNNPRVSDTLAVAYMKVKKYPEAEQLLIFARSQIPTNEEFTLHYAEVLYYLNEIEKSKSVLYQVSESKQKNKILTLIQGEAN